MLNLLFYSMTYKYLAGGPFAPHLVVDAENCKVNWWSNILMMHNIVSTDKLVSYRLCRLSSEIYCSHKNYKCVKNFAIKVKEIKGGGGGVVTF